MIKACLRAAACAATLLVAACGGGGGEPNFIQPLPPTPSPTYDTFPLANSASFETITATRWLDRSGVGNVFDFSVHSRGSNGISIGYDAATGSYTVNEGSFGGTFTAANRTSNGFFDVYTDSSQPNRQLILFNNVRAGASQAGAPVQLTYLSFGRLTVDDPIDNPLTGTHLDTYLLFGYPTLTSDMPKTGTASYSTAVFASTTSLTRGDPITSITGNATFMADFASGTVTTSLTLPFAQPGGSSSTYDGSGSISGNAFSGIFKTSNDPNFSSGNFDGGFFGPNAAEMGYTFTLLRAGSIRPTYTIGAVVGKKSGN